MCLRFVCGFGSSGLVSYLVVAFLDVAYSSVGCCGYVCWFLVLFSVLDFGFAVVLLLLVWLSWFTFGFACDVLGF